MSSSSSSKAGKPSKKSSKHKAAAAPAAPSSPAPTSDGEEAAVRVYLVLLGDSKYKLTSNADSFDELRDQLAAAYSIGYHFDLQYYDAEVAEYLDFTDVSCTVRRVWCYALL